MWLVTYNSWTYSLQVNGAVGGMRAVPLVEVFLWAVTAAQIPPWSNILTKAFEEQSCQRQPPDQTLIS